MERVLWSAHVCTSCTVPYLWEGHRPTTTWYREHTCWVLKAGQLLPDGADDLSLALGHGRNGLQQVHRLGSDVCDAAADEHRGAESNRQIDCIAGAGIHVLLHTGGAVVCDVDAGVVGVVDDVVDTDARDTVAGRTEGVGLKANVVSAELSAWQVEN